MSENKSIEQQATTLAGAVIRTVHLNRSLFGTDLEDGLRTSVTRQIQRSLTAAYEQGFWAGTEAQVTGTGKPENVFTVAQYLNQGVQYFSDSKLSMQPISTMPRKYAANAAEKMIREAKSWADQAGNITRTPAVWITSTEIYRALVERSQYGTD